MQVNPAASSKEYGARPYREWPERIRSPAAYLLSRGGTHESCCKDPVPNDATYDFRMRWGGVWAEGDEWRHWRRRTGWVRRIADRKRHRAAGLGRHWYANRLVSRQRSWQVA